jgi:hypothetical protein
VLISQKLTQELFSESEDRYLILEKIIFVLECNLNFEILTLTIHKIFISKIICFLFAFLLLLIIFYYYLLLIYLSNNHIHRGHHYHFIANIT